MRPGTAFRSASIARVVLRQRAARRFALRALRIGVGLLVDHEQQIEGIEEEVPAAAGGIEDAQVSRVLLRPRREFLAGLADHVFASLRKRRVRAAHLVPDAAERVVGQELDDVAGREELVADRQFAAVARRLALLAHLPPLVLAVEILVDPADRLVLAPHPLQIVAVERREQPVERGLARPKRRSRVATVEQHLHLGRKLVEDALDVEPIAASIRKLQARREAAKLVGEARDASPLLTHS